MRSGCGPSPVSAAKMRSKMPSRLQRMKRLMGAMLFWSGLPLQSVADHIDNTSDNPPVIDLGTL
jgi:hypothetical protein